MFGFCRCFILRKFFQFLYSNFFVFHLEPSDVSSSFFKDILRVDIFRKRIVVWIIVNLAYLVTLTPKIFPAMILMPNWFQARYSMPLFRLLKKWEVLLFEEDFFYSDNFRLLYSAFWQYFFYVIWKIMLSGMQINENVFSWLFFTKLIEFKTLFNNFWLVLRKEAANWILPNWTEATKITRKVHFFAQPVVG